MVKLINVLAGKIILAVKVTVATDRGTKEVDKTVILDKPSMAIEMDLIGKVGYDERLDTVWADADWLKYLNKSKWLRKLDEHFPIGDKVATSMIDRMKMIYFIESIDYDEEMCSLILEKNREIADAQRQVLDMNIAELAYKAKGKNVKNH